MIKTAQLNSFLCRVLVVVMLAGMIGPGLGVSPASAADVYTVTYDGNGSDGGSVPFDPTGYEPGDAVLVHDNSNGLTKAGYIFDGWTTAPDGSGTHYLPGQTFQMGGGNVTLYAKWIDASASWVNRSAAGSQFNDVVYGNGAFYAVGNSGVIAASIDGAFWTKQTSGTNAALYDITSGGGKLAAVGANGTILVSSDGENWSPRSSGTTKTLRAIAYGNGMFVAVGDSGAIVVSGNGSIWTPVASGTTSQLNGVAYANGKFIAVGKDSLSFGTILTSSDGLAWNVSDVLVFFELRDVAAGGGKIVAVGVGGTVAVSTDGDQWNVRFSVIPTDFTDVAYGNGTFIATGSMDREINFSTDGNAWTSTKTTSTTRSGAAYGDGVYVVVGNTGIATSADGTSWTTYADPNLYGMAYGNGKFAAVGSDGSIYTSATGAVWRKQTSAAQSSLRGITYGGGLFVAVGDAGTILTSSNGEYWAVQTSPTSNRLNGVAWGNGRFTAVGASGTVVHSVDGENWTLADTGYPDLDVRAVAYGVGIFAAVGASGTDGMIYTSEDGATWIGTTVSGVDLYGIAGSAALLVAAGIGTDGNASQNVYYSVDGLSWNRSDSGTPQQINSVAYDSGTFMLAGLGGAVRTTQDGIHYASAASGISATFQAVAGGGGTFVAAGLTGAVAQPRQEAPANYVIHFDANGGTGKANPTAMMLMPGETVGALPAPPSLAGYSFGGWNTAPDGSGTALDASSVVTADTVVYAQWVTLPDAPANLTASAGFGEVTLTWDAVSGAASYAVYMYEGESAPADPGDWELVADGITATAYKLTELENGVTLAFAVTATNAAGTSDYSASAVATPGGKGTPDDPIIITTPQRLYDIRQDLDAWYALADDIDLSGFGDWLPIGWPTAFTGHLDGRGHTISGLRIRSGEMVIRNDGLFGTIGNGGKVENLVLADVDIVTENGATSVGALAGKLEGEAVNIRVSGGSVKGVSYVGGLVGETSGGAVIAASCASVKVEGGDFNAGGLVGYLSNASVTTSCATGDVIGNTYVGGLAGTIDASVMSDSYATGSVSGYSNVGGLIGMVTFDTETLQATSTVERVHAAGRVENSGVSVGGLIGANTAPLNLSAAYYDKDTTGQSDENSSSGTPLSHEQMGLEESFEDWDFDEIWHLDSRDGWPTFLRDDDRAPEMGSAVVSNDAPFDIVVSFTETVEVEDEALERFTVTVNGNAAAIADKQRSGKQLILTLSQQVLNGQAVEVAYADGDPAILDKLEHRMASHTIEADNETKPLIKLVSVSPTDNATGVSRNPQLVLTFSNTVEAMAGKYIQLMDEAGALVEKIEAISSKVQIADKVVTITLDADLLPLTGYYVLIDSGAFRHSAFDVYGGIADPTAWNFMTEQDPDAQWLTVKAGFTEGRANTPVLRAGADGTLYALFGDQANGGKATVMKLAKIDKEWSPVGSAGFSTGAIGAPSLLVDGNVLYAAFGVVDADNQAAVHVMKYELGGEGDWTPAGDPIPVGDFIPDFLADQDQYPFLIKHNGAVHVAYRDGTTTGPITVKKLNAGGQWETVGDARFSEGDVYDPSLVVLDGTLYAGFTDYTFSAGYGATVMKYDPGSGEWLVVGERGFTPDHVFDTSFVTDGKKLYVVYEYDGLGAHKASAMVFDPEQGEWVAASGDFSTGQAFGMDAAGSNGALYSAFKDAGRSNRVVVKKYAGGDWVAVGAVSVTPGSASDPSLIVHDGILYVAFEDGTSSGKLSVMKYSPYNRAPQALLVSVDGTLKRGQTLTGKYYYVDEEYDEEGDSQYQWYFAEDEHGTGKTAITGATGTTLELAEDDLDKYVIFEVTPVAAEGVLQGATVTSAPAGPVDYADSTINPETAVFDKYAESAGYADVTTTMTLNWNTFESISNNGVPLVVETDYTVSGNNVTIKKEYLEQQETGTTKLTFTFSAGAAPTLSIAIKDTTPPDAPELLTAEWGNRQVTLTWSQVEGATDYKIYASETSGSYGTEVDTVASTEDSYTVTDLTNGTTYYFAVKAIREEIESEFSNELSAVPLSAPAAPKGVSAVAGNGQATVTFAAPDDDGGSEITGYEVTVSPGDEVVTGTESPIVITGLKNGTRYTFTVRAINSVGPGDPAVSNSVVPYSPYTGPLTTNDDGVSVLINGKDEKVGTATTSDRNGQTVTTISIDPVGLGEKLAEEGLNAIVTIPAPKDAEVVVGELDGRMVKNMENQQAVLQIVTERATYTIPAQQIQIDAISAQIGETVELSDIKVQIEVGEPAAETVRLVENAAANGTFTIVVPAVEFTVRATYGDTTVEVTKFTAYVERTIAIPEGSDPGKITTGVVIDPDGTLRHVPTRIVFEDGRYFAVINSLTNSPYTVVWNPVEFRDMASHWAKASANNMGSRMILEGTGDGLFSPDRAITRAEFAAIIVRALGLGRETSAGVFPDVRESDWFDSAVGTAYAYGLLSGYGDGTFRPNDRITREQAMVILSRAMAMAGLKAKLPDQDAASTLSAFADWATASGWAAQGMADCVQAGIVLGKSGNLLAPQDTITRAEAAAMVERLLQKSGLI